MALSVLSLHELLESGFDQFSIGGSRATRGALSKYLSMQTIKAGNVPSRKNDIPAMMARPINIQVMIIHAVNIVRPCMMGT